MMLRAGARQLCGQARCVNTVSNTTVTRKGLTRDLSTRFTSRSFLSAATSRNSRPSGTSINQNIRTYVRGHVLRDGHVRKSTNTFMTRPTRGHSTGSNMPPPADSVANSSSGSSSSSSGGWSYTVTPKSIPLIFLLLIPLHALSVACTAYITWGYLLSPEWKDAFSTAAQATLLKTSTFMMQSSELREAGKMKASEIITVLLQVRTYVN